MNKVDFIKVSMSDVPEGYFASLDNEALYIPIHKLEDMLDVLNFSTRNFQHQVYKNEYSKMCVAASLELCISYLESDGSAYINRSFVGACNFELQNLLPNTHFLATAKSECIKNAASDIGKYFGRGINVFTPPQQVIQEKKVTKSKPDSKILQQFADAVAKGDDAAIQILTNIYDIKTN